MHWIKVRVSVLGNGKAMLTVWEWHNSLAEMELRILLAAFFLRFDASVDSSLKDEDMELYDSFSASPVGGKFLLNLRERL
jgi:hypothetical protein